MITERKKLRIALLILVTIVSGCRLILNQLKPNLFAGNSAYTAAQAVKSKIGGSSFRVQQIEITEATFKMIVESPTNTQNIDEYNYIGIAAVGPKPVKRDAMTASREKMPFEAIDFTLVPQIIKNALERTQIAGGTVERMTLEARDGQKFRWRIEIKGTRENASAWADLAGNITGTDLSQASRAADYKVLNETELNKAVAALKERLGENARLTEVTIREKLISISVISGQNSKDVEIYSFGIDGLKKSTLPAMPAGLSKQSFSFDELNLPDAVTLVQKARERLAMPDGELSFVTFGSRADVVLVGKLINGIPYKEAEQTSQLTWSVNLKRGTGFASVDYDTKLNEIAVRKD